MGKFMPRLRGLAIKQGAGWGWECFVTIGPDDSGVAPIAMAHKGTPFINREAAMNDLREHCAGILKIACRSMGLPEPEGVLDLNAGMARSIEEFTKPFAHGAPQLTAEAFEELELTPDEIRTLPAVLDEVFAERRRQHEKWGEQNWPDGTGDYASMGIAADKKAACDRAFKDKDQKGTFRHILDEEVAEAFAESDPVKLREELIQVAAVAVAWVQAIDRRKNGKL